MIRDTFYPCYTSYRLITKKLGQTCPQGKDILGGMFFYIEPLIPLFLPKPVPSFYNDIDYNPYE